MLALRIDRFNLGRFATVVVEIVGLVIKQGGEVSAEPGSVQHVGKLMVIAEIEQGA